MSRQILSYTAINSCIKSGRSAWWCATLCSSVALFVAVFVALGGAATKATAQGTKRSENATFPKFFSLKSNPVNLRKGPGTRYPKVWVFRREGLPVQVLRAHERWREVRDPDGATGWILRTLISRRRTAIVRPPQGQSSGQTKSRRSTELTTLHSGPRAGSSAVARLEPGALVNLKTCERGWCHLSIGAFRGYVEQRRLWGVGPREVLR